MFLQHLAKRIDEAKNKFKNSKHIDYDELTPEQMEQVAISSDYKNVTKYIIAKRTNISK